MNINKNTGFTLIELLAVITILSLLALLTTTAVSKLVIDSKSDLNDVQENAIIMAAESWGADNSNLLPGDSECGYITLGDLKDYGLLDDNILDLENSTKLSDDIKIKVSSSYSLNGSLNTEYEYNVSDSDVSSCTKIYDTICTKVETSTFGNVPSGDYEIGDEYTCTVKTGVSYTFYVVSTEGNRVNLIMDSNIDISGTSATSSSNVSWISLDDYITYGGSKETYEANSSNIGDSSLGPITALNYLYEATKDWNIPNILVNYTDEGETQYGKIVTSGIYLNIIDSNNNKITSYTNMKARLPFYSEIYSILPEKKWYLNNLAESTYVTGTTNVSGIKGYWLLTTGDEYAYDSKVVTSDGAVIEKIVSDSSNYGVRPIINVPKRRIEG